MYSKENKIWKNKQKLLSWVVVLNGFGYFYKKNKFSQNKYN